MRPILVTEVQPSHTRASESRPPGRAPRPGWFEATHWSVVLAAGQADAEGSRRAVEALCATYWEPLYTFLRCQGCQPQDAEDLTQSFLAHLLARNPFARLNPSNGRFRSFLLKSLRNFLADRRDHDRAVKRGGQSVAIPFDQELAERHHLEAAAQDRPPEAAFDRRWAVTVLNRAYATLEGEFAASGKASLFVELSPFLAAEGHAAEYAAVGTRLQMTPNAVSVAVHRLRQRYGDLIRAEVAHTVPEPADVEPEMRYLLDLLCR